MWTVERLSRELAEGRTTSRALVEQALARIADPAGEGARAFLKVYADAARAEAEHSDRLRRSGVVRSPVEGLPVSVKDLYDVGGDVTRAGSKLLAFFNSRFVLVTRGKDGMTLFEATRDNRRPSGSVHIPSLERQVFDRTGAGDTVISTLALSSAAGASMREAAVLANHAAGIVVGKLGTATLTPRELLQSLHADRG